MPIMSICVHNAGSQRTLMPLSWCTLMPMSGRGTQPRYQPGSFSQRLLPGDSRHHHFLFARSEDMDNSGCGEPGLRGTVVI